MSTPAPLDTSSLYQTVPLQDPETQIRLLRVKRWKKEFLSYDFIVCGLADAPLYDAISYTWGDPSERGSIWVNNVCISVTENCRYALWQVRKLGSSYVWIDAVCINQQDLQEKSAQVAMMFNIYQSASQVLACIGPPDDASERICAVLIQFDARTAGNHEDEEVAESWLVDKGHAFREALWQDYVQLSSRPYFSRLWIAQELFAGGPRTYIMFGAAKLAWQLVLLMLEALERDSCIEETKKPPQISYLDALFEEANTRFGAHLMWMQDIDLLCYDVRDKIYGTLQFFDWENAGITPLQPDYTLSPCEVAVSIASLMLDVDGIGVSGLADMVIWLEITASDPCLQPYLFSHDTRLHQSQNERRQWEVYTEYAGCLDQVDKSCEKGSSCILRCNKSPECNASDGLTHATTCGQSVPDSLAEETAHCSIWETTAEGSSVIESGNRGRYIAPKSTKAGDIVITFSRHLGMDTSLVVREESEQETISVIGKASRSGPSQASSQHAPHSQPSWRAAIVTMEATIEEMISFLVPYDSRFEFDVPKIVSLTTRTGSGINDKDVKKYTTINMSSSLVPVDDRVQGNFSWH